jgi:poly(A) polymerase
MDDARNPYDIGERPVILAKPGHPISRHAIDSDAYRILYRLQKLGFIAYLCGGAVRDLLLGKTPKDYDIVTDARPGQIKKRFANVYVIGRRFRLAHIHFPGGKIIEAATFRRDPEPEDPAGPPSHFEAKDIYGTPREDAFRRDITINALFYDPFAETVIDYVGGLEDLAERRVRIIGDPVVRFTEDCVRVWRVLRHAARLEFSIEEGTERAIVTHGHLLANAAGSRLFEEFNKDLAYETRPVLEALRNGRLLRHILGQVGETYESHPEMFGRLGMLLDIEERARRDGLLLSLEEMYALVLWPWIEPLFAAAAGEDMHSVLNTAVLEAGAKMTIPKLLRANVIQILIIVDSMIRALRTGHMRWSLLRLSHADQAARLFFMIMKCRPPAAGETFEGIYREAFPSAPAGPERKRRRRRRRRPQNPPSGGSGTV